MDHSDTEIISCKNCGTNSPESGKYCSGCGQTLHIHRFTLAHFIHEMFHAFTHADKGIILLIKDLVKKPGVVMYNYIVAGKRKSYFNPFIFIVLTGGFLLFSNALFKPYNTKAAKFETAQATAIPNTKPELKGQEKQYAERGSKLNYFMEKNSKIIMLGSVPISSLVFFLFFRKRDINYAEHLVAMCLLTGVTALLMGILMVPLMALLKNTPYVWIATVLLLLIQLVYFGWAYLQFFSKMTRIAKWKPYVVSAVNILVWTIITAGAGFLYIAWPMISKS